MFAEEHNAEDLAKIVISQLGSREVTKAHARHINADDARYMGLHVIQLEDDKNLQDAVLSVHHAFIHTLSETDAFKIIENHMGIAFVQQATPF